MDLQRQILDYLESKRVFHYRQASGVSSGYGGHRIGPKGGPNIICVINGQYIGIAASKPGAKRSEHQNTFQRALEAAGGKYVLASSLEDVIKALALTESILAP